MKDYRKLFSFAKPYWRLLVLAGFFMGIVTILDIFRLSAIVPLIDRVFTDKPVVFTSGKFPVFIEQLLNQLNAPSL
jgi:ABC-type multidrug transport system fused ATPase/permease subunit